jgi:hypothetical protein
MWLYMFESQFINVTQKVVTKGVIIKGVYCISIRWVWNSVVQILNSSIDTHQLLTQVYAHSPEEGDINK